jgi:putative transposase
MIHSGELILDEVADVDERNRPRYDRVKLRYPSDLTDAECTHVASMIPRGRQWRAIPKDLPPKSTVYGYFDLWMLISTLN